MKIEQIFYIVTWVDSNIVIEINGISNQKWAAYHSFYAFGKQRILLAEEEVNGRESVKGKRED